MFAFAWRYRAANDALALKLMYELLDFIDTRMRAPDGEGFLHTAPSHGPRLQNPHMHLLEASLAAFEATQDQRFLDLADELVALFQRRFLVTST